MSITPDKRALSSKIKAAQIEFHDDHALKTYITKATTPLL